MQVEPLVGFGLIRLGGTLWSALPLFIYGALTARTPMTNRTAIPSSAVNKISMKKVRARKMQAMAVICQSLGVFPPSFDAVARLGVNL